MPVSAREIVTLRSVLGPILYCAGRTIAVELPYLKVDLVKVILSCASIQINLYLNIYVLLYIRV